MVQRLTGSAAQQYCRMCGKPEHGSIACEYAKGNDPLVYYSRGADRSLEQELQVGGEPHWVAEASIPFDTAYSKNRLWRPKAGGGHYIDKDVKRDSIGLGLLLRASLKKMGPDFHIPPKSKVFLDIFVAMPNHRGDAINYLDFVADAVKGAIGIDDRWFAVWRLDWAVLSKKEKAEGKKGEIRVKVGI